VRILVISLTLATATSQGASRPAAQEIGELDLLLDRLGRYLAVYRSQLNGIVADERYEQQEILVIRRNRNVSERVRDRKLDSEVAFLGLPGGGPWIVRDVRRVDGRAVLSSAVRLDELVQRQDPRRFEDAAKIAAASAAHNLGGQRTINVPTTPLEILQVDHHVQFIFKVRGQDKIDGTTTTRLDFEEFDEPTLINNIEGDLLFIRGTAWVEPADGRLWRVQLAIRPKPSARTPRGLETRLRVDFALHPTLNLMLPTEMTEEFFVLGGRGNGRARYSNFRRFTPVPGKGPAV